MESKKRGRPAKIKQNINEPMKDGIHPDTTLLKETVSVDVIVDTSNVLEVIKEIIITKEIEKPQLQDFELYKALKDANFPQGGIGQFMEDPNSTERVYVPHASEIYGQFAQNPEGWNVVRDYLARAFLELKNKNAI